MTLCPTDPSVQYITMQQGKRALNSLSFGIRVQMRVSVQFSYGKTDEMLVKY